MADKQLQRDNGGTCVEVGTAAPAVAVRDSNHPDGPQLTFLPATLTAFTRQLKADRRSGVLTGGHARLLQATQASCQITGL